MEKNEKPGLVEYLKASPSCDDLADSGEPFFRTDIEQAEALRERAARDGLRFDAYLPPSIAEWVLDEIIAGDFVDPSEVAFYAVKEFQELSRHPQVREALLKAKLEMAMAQVEAGDVIPGEEVFARLREQVAEMEEPPCWTGKGKAESL